MILPIGSLSKLKDFGFNDLDMGVWKWGLSSISPKIGTLIWTNAWTWRLPLGFWGTIFFRQTHVLLCWSVLQPQSSGADRALTWMVCWHEFNSLFFHWNFVICRYTTHSNMWYLLFSSHPTIHYGGFLKWGYLTIYGLWGHIPFKWWFNGTSILGIPHICSGISSDFLGCLASPGLLKAALPLLPLRHSEEVPVDSLMSTSHHSFIIERFWRLLFRLKSNGI